MVVETDVYGAEVPVIALVPDTAVVFAHPRRIVGMVLQVIRGTGRTDGNFDALAVVVHMANDNLLLALAGVCRVSDEGSCRRQRKGEERP
jgi:hypothetical protein